MKKIDRLPMKLGKIADLVYFDGPFVSLFEDNERKTYYLYCWCDIDINKKFNRWLIFKVRKEQIESHINGDTSLRNMVIRAESCFLCDINNDVEYENIYLTAPSELPKSYIPKMKSFFDPELVGSEEDLSILNKRFMSDSSELTKQKGQIIQFESIKKPILSNVVNQSFKKEIRNAA